jgi:predicted TIM-barrel fold metal-dependent hydrolase
MNAVFRDLLVDPHHHLWDSQVLGYGRPLSPSRYLLSDFLADAAGVSLVGSVHLQAEVERGFSVAETRWLQEMADRHGFPHGIVAYANLADPSLEWTLEEHAEAPNLRGIRQILNRALASVSAPTTSPIRPGWRATDGSAATVSRSTCRCSPGR